MFKSFLLASIFCLFAVSSCSSVVMDTIPIFGVRYADEGSISGFVWQDLNENGVQNEGEKGIPGVNVSLYNYMTGDFIDNTISNETGYYTFGVPYGSYRVITGMGQEIEYGSEVCIGMPGDPCDWCPTKVGIGDPDKDSNDHNHTLVIDAK